MSARDDAVEIIRRICPAHLDADQYARLFATKFDAHSAEAIAAARREDAEVLYAESRAQANRAIFSTGIKHAARLLAERAEEAAR